ncbi:hypothetical protein ACXYMU_09605 [Pontibacter sp. CAU 1760]
MPTYIAISHQINLHPKTTSVIVKLKQIKAIVDAIGREYLDNYDTLYISELTPGQRKRYSLKKAQPLPSEPDELSNTKLEVRICTDYVNPGDCSKEIGMPGRYIFDKLKQEKVYFKGVYLTTSKGKGYSNAIKRVVDHFDSPTGYEWFIDEPHFATVLNFYDLPEAVREEKVKKFIRLYFEWVTSEKREEASI